MTEKQDSTIAHATQIVASALAAGSDKEAILRLAAGYAVWLEALRADVDRAINQIRIAEALTIGDLTLEQARDEIRELGDEVPNLTPASYGADMLLAAATGAVQRRMFREDVLNALRDALPNLDEASDREGRLLLEMFGAVMAPPTLATSPIPAEPTTEAAAEAARDLATDAAE